MIEQTKQMKLKPGLGTFTSSGQETDLPCVHYSLTLLAIPCQSMSH